MYYTIRARIDEGCGYIYLGLTAREANLVQETSGGPLVPEDGAMSRLKICTMRTCRSTPSARQVRGSRAGQSRTQPTVLPLRSQSLSVLAVIITISTCLGERES